MKRFIYLIIMLALEISAQETPKVIFSTNPVSTVAMPAFFSSLFFKLGSEYVVDQNHGVGFDASYTKITDYMHFIDGSLKYYMYKESPTHGTYSAGALDVIYANKISENHTTLVLSGMAYCGKRWDLKSYLIGFDGGVGMMVAAINQNSSKSSVSPVVNVDIYVGKGF